MANELTISSSSEINAAKARFGIVGNAPALIAAISRAIQVAPIDLSVLVTGESGSGKEFFPKIIHAFSARKHSKYIAVNCGAIPEGTIDSELFGHEKGAFTGAVSSRKGYFEEADGGTIFLDEVAELPMTTQARLLRVLETGEFLKVGSSEVQHTNLRVVAATNVDLIAAIHEGRFREDLYYRLSTVLIQVPPLRDRGNDVVMLARKFASDFAEKYMTAPVTFDEDARQLLMQYRWPGNVRQLKNVIDQLSLFDAGREITKADIEQYIPRNATMYSPVHVEHDRHDYSSERELLFNMVFGLRQEIERLRNEIDRLNKTPQQTPHNVTPARSAAFDAYEEEPVTQSATEPPATALSHLPLSLQESEKDTIRRALEMNNGSRRDTAAALNISERTLYRKLREYNIE